MVVRKIRIGVLTTSMGYGHIMKAQAIKAALEKIEEKEAGLHLESEILTEKDYFSPAGRAVRSAIERFYGLTSKSSLLRGWWDRASGSSGYSSGRRMEGLYSGINRSSRSKKDLSSFQCIISTHPFDRVSGIPEGIPVIRVLPDIFAHSFYTAERKNTETWYAAPDKELARRIRSGEEKYIEKAMMPSHPGRVVFTGAFCHPANLDQRKEGFERLLSRDRLPVIFQIGGAGAQLGILIEALKRTDLKKADPLFALGDHRQAFEIFITAAHSCGKVSDSEKDRALRMKKEDFDRDSILRFSSGFRAMFHPERYEAAKRIDLLKKDNALNIVKPGDVTSAGIPYLLLYPIGAQEYENGRWAVSKGFARWLIEPREYGILRKKAAPMLDRLSGEMAEAYLDSVKREELVKMHGCLEDIDARGAFNTSALSIIIAAKRIGADDAARKLEPFCTKGFLKGINLD